MATFLAFKMREAGVMTFVDFFRQRFGADANWLAAMLSIPTSVIWASAQLLAMGEIIVSEVTTLDLTMGLLDRDCGDRRVHDGGRAAGRRDHRHRAGQRS